MKNLKFSYLESPVGMLKLIANEKNLVAILWDNEKLNRVKLDQMEENNQHPILLKTAKELLEYFSGKRKTFSIPMEVQGTTFQKAVWEILNQIPYGETWSYKQVAELINNPKAVRAVGTAIGRNPVSIIIPCHRVIGTNGTLTGFAGGLDKKQTLLVLEKPKDPSHRGLD